MGDIIVGAMIGSGYGAMIAMAARWVFARFIDKEKIPSPVRQRDSNIK